MGYLDKIHPRRSGAVSKVVELAEYGGASWLYGYAQTRYREKASIKGVPLDLAAGVGLKLLDIVGSLWAKDYGGGVIKRAVRSASPHAGVLGNAGIGAFMHTWGAGVGGEKSGVKRLLVQDKDVDAVKKALGGRVTVLGEIPKAPQPGKFFSARELARMAG